jgi:hypothetical protein
VTQSLHDRRYRQALISKGVSVGFSEPVQFWLRYALTLSYGLQLAEEVSLHTADGVGEDQIGGVGTFRNHPVP